jgi:predicted RNA-binding protein YlqC (UPF0109 family)
VSDQPLVEPDETPESVENAEPDETPESSESAEPDEAPESSESAEIVTATANQGQAPTATAVLTHVVRSIVDDAEAVKVDAVEGRNRLKLEVKVGPGDLGRVIGRRGRTAQSIRTVVRAAATRDGVEVDVDFVD